MNLAELVRSIGAADGFCRLPKHYPDAYHVLVAQKWP